MKIEIERKFLLKSMPDIPYKEIIKIEQFYLKNENGIWERARFCDSSINGKYWIHTIKKNISKCSNMEDEKSLTESEFNLFKTKCYSIGSESKYIQKDRLVYPDGDLYWEVDVFHSGHHLIVAEIEIPTEKFKINIPNFIKDKMLMEVTGYKQFSNKSLSNKIVNLTNN